MRLCVYIAVDLLEEMSVDGGTFFFSNESSRERETGQDRLNEEEEEKEEEENTKKSAYCTLSGRGVEKPVRTRTRDGVTRRAPPVVPRQAQR